MRNQLTLRECLFILFIDLTNNRKESLYLYEIIASNTDYIDQIYQDEWGFYILDNLTDEELYIAYLDLEYYIIPQELFDKESVIEEVRLIEIELLEEELREICFELDTLVDIDPLLDRYLLIQMELNLLIEGEK